MGSPGTSSYAGILYVFMVIPMVSEDAIGNRYVWKWQLRCAKVKVKIDEMKVQLSNDGPDARTESARLTPAVYTQCHMAFNVTSSTSPLQQRASPAAIESSWGWADF